MSEYIHMTISINQNNTLHSNKLQWSEGNWFDLYKVTKLYEYSATNFVNGKRNNKFAKGISTIILDFDEDVSLDEAINIFREHVSLIVTTKSHQKDKHGLVCDRFRVILPLQYSIIDIEYYMQLMQTIVRYYKSDKACTDAARYYSPNPNQKTYYSSGTKYFDISKFEEMIEKKEDVFDDTPSFNTYPEKYRSINLEKKIDLTSFMNEQIIYYQNGLKSINTLTQIIKSKHKLSQLKCHCFLNPRHEDKNPSCVLYLNDKNIYAKCFSCNLDASLRI